ncbi:hypothetical protein HAP47_0026390 [Bradyrhizobium sp. 41S5]|uniref:ABC transporter permease subunit n=1 Tax=Bradyrhizobium sp. 41S5 TaxID=1404443 RepID=UPI001AEE5902|nr:hypothetical protein [Bradyrhizobium sp. 41S5]UFX42748.1 hypothetical protein HAP47_0026390 [Bradyrhizobium sp. 41S5]
MLAIVRAFEEIQADDDPEGRPGLLALDEPTPFLPKEGVGQLFGLVRSITIRGSSVVFISHSIDEIMQITDQITVLRDGVVAGEATTGDATHDQVVEMIVGRVMARAPRVKKTTCDTPSVFARLSNLAGKMLKPTSIDLRKGEILGNGIPIARVQIGALLTSGVLAATAGIVYAGVLGSADPYSGMNYLLPAFAAAFLGATMILPGRFNAWGSMIAVYFLGTGITGLSMLGVPLWVTNVFNGAALILAVTISQITRGREASDIG